jgi:hypothetical protein
MMCNVCKKGLLRIKWLPGALAIWCVVHCTRCAAQSSLEASSALALQSWKERWVTPSKEQEAA